MRVARACVSGTERGGGAKCDRSLGIVTNIAACIAGTGCSHSELDGRSGWIHQGCKDAVTLRRRAHAAVRMRRRHPPANGRTGRRLGLGEANHNSLRSGEDFLPVLPLSGTRARLSCLLATSVSLLPPMRARPIRAPPSSTPETPSYLAPLFDPTRSHRHPPISFTPAQPRSASPFVPSAADPSREPYEAPPKFGASLGPPSSCDFSRLGPGILAGV